MRFMKFSSALVFLAFGLASAGEDDAPNAFYAMDTCTKRPYPRNDITPAQQFDLLKELGYAGIAWTEEARASQLHSGAGQGAGPQDVCDLLWRDRVCKRRVDSVRTDQAGHRGAPRSRHPHLAAYRRQRPEDRDSLRRVSNRGAIASLAAAAEQNGLRIAIYPHIGDWTERFKDAVRSWPDSSTAKTSA